MKDYTALDLYRDLFRKMLSERSTETVSNDSADYARILIAELLRSAHKEVWIYCTKFGRDVWGDADVLSALDAALGNGVAFNALTRQKPDAGSEAVRKLNDAGVVVRTVEDETSPVENFLVVDGAAYRFETDPEGRKGFACANGAKNAQTLVKAFQSLSARCKDAN